MTTEKHGTRSARQAHFRTLPAKAQRRVARRSLLRSLLYTLDIVVGYFVLPISSHPDSTAALVLLLGIVGVTLLLVWQVREITRSPFPRLRALEALATSAPLFFAVFAITYFVMEQAAPGNFNEHLTRLDAAYFTVTVFATVGFGDIVPVTEVARGVVTVQMLGDLVIVGLLARAVLNAVQVGMQRRESDDSEPTGRDDPP
ncbi:MAG: potassium channel family protein [Nocardioidaceae bacterium]